MNALRTHLLRAAALLLGVGLVGCGPDYDQTRIDGITKSDLGGSIDHSRVEVPVGMIVKAHIAPMNDDNKVMKGALSSLDPSIMEVRGVVTEYDYAFIGLRPGATQIEVRADDKLVLILDAYVVPQPATP